MTRFFTLIHNWYQDNQRNLPWRETKDPYKIWLSEIILQQTRVNQGINYYYRFIERFPNIQSLATADEQEVLRLWQGLGYYSRARNLLFAANQIMTEFNGVFPKEHRDIKSLKGIGDYTAAAIASFAYNLPYPVVDGNVYRVLSRYYNEETPIDSSLGKKIFLEYAEQLIDKKKPGEFNQAIMELGALVCKPQNPNCTECPLKDSCLAFKNKNWETFPVKSKSTKIRVRHFYYLVFPSHQVQLEKRTEKDIWQNMFQFPLLESDKKLKQENLQKMVEQKFQVSILKMISSEKRILSHQHIHASFWEIDLPIKKDYIKNISFSELDDFPIPRVIELFFEANAALFIK